MKKLLLASLLIGASLTSALSAEAERIPHRRKKSKEAALIKVLYGGYIAHHNLNALYLIFVSAWNNSQTRTFCINNSLFPLLFFVSSYSMAQQGLNDLEEIAQTE